MSNITSGVTNGGSDAASKWATVAAQLRAYRDQQQAAWGDLDDTTVAKYLANEATDEEIAQVEAAMERYPAVGQAIGVIKEVLK